MKKKSILSGKKLSRREALVKASRWACLAGLYPLLNSCNLSESSSSQREGGDSENSSGYSSWAVGGTGLITLPFPDDGIFDDGDYCTEALASQQELGDCYYSSESGEDISENKSGLPTQLCLRLIDSNCNPLSGYVIEVWHCDNVGLYSGNSTDSEDVTSFEESSCTQGDVAAKENNWFRGLQATNINGRVNFKTIFPGWIEGRTIHIHVAIRDSSGDKIFISQLCFDDDLTYDICTEHSLYNFRGEQDVTLASGQDSIFPIYNYDVYQMKSSQSVDGTLLVYHSIQLTNI